MGFLQVRRMEETNLQKRLAMEFGAKGLGRLWINDNGMAFHKIGKDDYRPFRYGMGKGIADLIGFTLVDGKPIFTAFEVKTKTGRASEEQKNFIAMVRANGGIAGIVRGFAEIEEEIRQWHTK